jgi:hypothetical protein
LDDDPMESLDWLLEEFFYGIITYYFRPSDGTTQYNAGSSPCTADVKLEQLINFTRERREQFRLNSDSDILTDDELAQVVEDLEMELRAVRIARHSKSGWRDSN